MLLKSSWASVNFKTFAHSLQNYPFWQLLQLSTSYQPIFSGGLTERDISTVKEKKYSMAAENAMAKFSQLFGRRSAVVIGMIHVDALPGKSLLIK